MANTKGPKKIWVPKKNIFTIVDVLDSRKQMPKCEGLLLCFACIKGHTYILIICVCFSFYHFSVSGAIPSV